MARGGRGGNGGILGEPGCAGRRRLCAGNHLGRGARRSECRLAGADTATDVIRGSAMVAAMVPAMVLVRRYCGGGH